jgi:thiamine biosynthesis protein ThiS
VTIRLNGDPYELAAPTSVSALLEALDIDARRVAVELNLVVLKRAAFPTTMIQAGDVMEIVNFVGGGAVRRPA